MAYKFKDRTFTTIDDYFDHMAETYGYTPYHHHFEKDALESDGNKLHLDIYVHDKDAPTIVLIPGTSLYALCYVEIMYKIAVSGLQLRWPRPTWPWTQRGNPR